MRNSGTREPLAKFDANHARNFIVTAHPGVAVVRPTPDMSVIDANTGLAGDQAFAFIGAAAFSGVAGQLRAQVGGGATVVSGDLNGDSAADFAINPSLTPF